MSSQESYSSPDTNKNKRGFPESIRNQINSFVETMPTSNKERDILRVIIKQMGETRDFIFSLHNKINLIENSYAGKPEKEFEKEKAYENIVNEIIKEAKEIKEKTELKK